MGSIVTQIIIKKRIAVIMTWISVVITQTLLPCGVSITVGDGKKIFPEDTKKYLNFSTNYPVNWQTFRYFNCMTFTIC